MTGWREASKEVPTCEPSQAVDVWICIDDQDYPEEYTRILGYWVNKIMLYPEGVDDDLAGEEVTGFVTAEDNVLTRVTNAVYWQYLPEIPKKVAS